MEDAVIEDDGAEAAAALEGLLSAGAEGVVHPVAGGALATAAEVDALELEIGVEPAGEIDAGGDDVSAEDGGAFVADVEPTAKGLEIFLGEEGDLAFVGFLEIKKAVVFYAAASEALQVVDFLHGSIAGRVAVVTEVIVGGRDVEMEEIGHGNQFPVYIVRQGRGSGKNLIGVARRARANLFLYLRREVDVRVNAK
jgi:hypothetical protein